MYSLFDWVGYGKLVQLHVLLQLVEVVDVLHLAAELDAAIEEGGDEQGLYGAGGGGAN